MSDFSKNSRVDLDFAELNRMGRRVPKNRNSKIANPDLQSEAVNITSDVEDLSDSYQIENMTEEELNEFVIKIGDVKKDSENKYPTYEEQLKDLIENFKIAHGKLNCLRNANKEKFNEFEKLHAYLVAEKLRQETVTLRRVTDEKQSQYKSEWKFFIDQINWEQTDYNWDTCSEFEDVKNVISTFESRLEKFLKSAVNWRVHMEKKQVA